MLQDSTIFVAGHRGLVGSAIVRRLQRGGCNKLLLAGRDQLDLRSRDSVEAFFAANKPEIVFLPHRAASKAH
jgi:GDP-L-fucose synthase